MYISIVRMCHKIKGGYMYILFTMHSLSMASCHPYPIVSAGYFEVEVDNINITKSTGWIQNPIYCEVAGNYLRDTWLHEAPLHSRVAIQVLEMAMQKKLFGNN